MTSPPTAALRLRPGARLGPPRSVRRPASGRAPFGCGLALVAALAAAAPAASAAEPNPTGLTAAECALIADDRERLACHDRATGRAATGAPVPLDEAAKVARDERRARVTTLGERWELDAASKLGTFVLRPYKPMYVLPVHGTDDPNTQPSSDGVDNTVTEPVDIRAVEAKVQLSFKAKLWETIGGSNVDLWAGYSQTSHWQVYTPELSRPFRETNYEPEVFALLGVDEPFLGGRLRMLGLGVNHQSNGRNEPWSRSWNRVIAQVGWERGDWSVLVRPWWRLHESADTDDNPGIEDYVGRGEVVVVRKAGSWLWSVQLRHSLEGGDGSRGSVLLDLAFPVSSYLKGHLQLFSGYGESLIDFNHRQTTAGIGISLAEWL